MAETQTAYGLLHKGKYHCMVDLLCILFGLTCFAYVELATALLVWSIPNQSNMRSAVQLSSPLW